MGSLAIQRGALLLLSLMSFVYLAFVLRVLRPIENPLWIQEEWQGDAHIGLRPQRQGMLHLDVAIIACYRDRVIHLNIFINYMNSFLLSQNSSARIYIIEQRGNDPFNRAKLFNVGYVEAKRDYNYSCFIFHDIDLIPENYKFIYRCADQPLHFSVGIDKFNYKLPYNALFGGVSALSEKQLKDVNGFSNSYWGWGGEDDDLYRRVKKKNYIIHRPPVSLARYTMLVFTGKHVQSQRNKDRMRILRTAEAKMATDGLSDLDYNMTKKIDHKTHIWILADLKYNATGTLIRTRRTPTNTTRRSQRKSIPKATLDELKSKILLHHRNKYKTSRGQQPGMLPKTSNLLNKTINDRNITQHGRHVDIPFPTKDLV